MLPDFLRLGNLRERLGFTDVSGAGASAKEHMDQLVATRDNMELLAAILSHAKLSVSSWGGTIYLVYFRNASATPFRTPQNSTTGFENTCCVWLVLWASRSSTFIRRLNHTGIH